MQETVIYGADIYGLSYAEWARHVEVHNSTFYDYIYCNVGTYAPAIDKLEVNGHLYRREWVSTDSGRQVEVFLESATPS